MCKLYKCVCVFTANSQNNVACLNSRFFLTRKLNYLLIFW
jgi:hypothetical protein